MNIDQGRVGLAIAGERRAIGYQDSGLVAELVRAAFLEGGLGLGDPRAPLRDLIEPGMSVLLKPNWVLHCNKGGHGMDCMVTHPAFIEAVLGEVLLAKPGRVLIADAPIQSTQFETLATPAWQDRVREMAAPCRVDFVDFRKSIWQMNPLGGKVVRGPRAERDYILYDLGRDSLLEEISTPVGRFRNTCYHPDVLSKTHYPGCHQYLLCREFFESDLVINLPKLKAHRKSGLTAALKNLVGINGDKDYLPHHRLGGSGEGGDCYAGKAPLKRAAESLYDLANRRISTPHYLPLAKTGSALVRLNRIITGDEEIEGGWFGNDTVWRMVLDLNRVALYGRSDGTLSEEPQRAIYSLTDGIVAGEGFGPLAPEPVPLGAVTFARSSAFADLAHAALMHFDWRKVPLVAHAFSGGRYPLTCCDSSRARFHVRGEEHSLEELARRFGMDFKAPRGWAGHIEMGR